MSNTCEMISNPANALYAYALIHSCKNTASVVAEETVNPPPPLLPAASHSECMKCDAALFTSVCFLHKQMFSFPDILYSHSPPPPRLWGESSRRLVGRMGFK